MSKDKKDREKYEITEEMKELILEWKSCMEIRDYCIGSIFKTKKAIKYGVLAEKANVKFWRLASELYPEMKDKGYYFSARDLCIYKDNK